MRVSVAVVLMLAVALGFGRSAGGATRWLPIGPVNVQPAELAKLAMIMWLAHSLAKKAHRVRTFSVGFLPHVIVAGLLMLLCLAQPDFGSAVMIALLTFVVLFAAGARAGYLLGGVLIALPVGYAAIASSPYRMRRITAFLEPFEHRQGAGYQITESLMSFGSGGWTGVGLGDGRQKLLFLPEAVAMGLLPTKGLALPFVSYGGSSLVVNAAAAGIILNVSRFGIDRPKAETSRASQPQPRLRPARGGAR